MTKICEFMFKLNYEHGQVLSTLYLRHLSDEYSLKTSFSTDSLVDIDYDIQFSPFLSSRYDRDKIITISDSE